MSYLIDLSTYANEPSSAHTVIPLPDGELTIGSQEGSVDVRLSGEDVTDILPVHCRLRSDALGYVWLRPFTGARVQVNGAAVAVTREHPLRHGDIVSFGNQKRFRFEQCGGFGSISGAGHAQGQVQPMVRAGDSLEDSQTPQPKEYERPEQNRYKDLENSVTTYGSKADTRLINIITPQTSHSSLTVGGGDETREMNGDRSMSCPNTISNDLARVSVAIEEEDLSVLTKNGNGGECGDKPRKSGRSLAPSHMVNKNSVEVKGNAEPSPPPPHVPLSKAIEKRPSAHTPVARFRPEGGLEEPTVCAENGGVGQVDGIKTGYDREVMGQEGISPGDGVVSEDVQLPRSQALVDSPSAEEWWKNLNRIANSVDEASPEELRQMLQTVVRRGADTRLTVGSTRRGLAAIEEVDRAPQRTGSGDSQIPQSKAGASRQELVTDRSSSDHRNKMLSSESSTPSSRHLPTERYMPTVTSEVSGTTSLGQNGRLNLTLSRKPFFSPPPPPSPSPSLYMPSERKPPLQPKVLNGDRDVDVSGRSHFPGNSRVHLERDGGPVHPNTNGNSSRGWVSSTGGRGDITQETVALVRRRLGVQQEQSYPLTPMANCDEGTLAGGDDPEASRQGPPRGYEHGGIAVGRGGRVGSNYSESAGVGNNNRLYNGYANTDVQYKYNNMAGDEFRDRGSAGDTDQDPEYEDQRLNYYHSPLISAHPLHGNTASFNQTSNPVATQRIGSLREQDLLLLRPESQQQAHTISYSTSLPSRAPVYVNRYDHNRNGRLVEADIHQNHYISIQDGEVYGDCDSQRSAHGVVNIISGRPDRYETPQNSRQGDAAALEQELSEMKSMLSERLQRYQSLQSTPTARLHSANHVLPHEVLPPPLPPGDRQSKSSAGRGLEHAGSSPLVPSSSAAAALFSSSAKSRSNGYIPSSVTSGTAMNDGISPAGGMNHITAGKSPSVSSSSFTSSASHSTRLLKSKLNNKNR